MLFEYDDDTHKYEHYHNHICRFVHSLHEMIIAAIESSCSLLVQSCVHRPKQKTKNASSASKINARAIPRSARVFTQHDSDPES